MLFTGRLGKRVQHHRRGGRLVEEVQRLEEDGYQVLLRGGGKYFWFEHKCKAICLLHKTTQLIKRTLVLSPKAQGPTHGTERRTRRRGRRVIGGFISTHIILRSINSDHPSPDQLRSKGHLFGLGTFGPVSYNVPRFAGIPSPWSHTLCSTLMNQPLVLLLQVLQVRRQQTQNKKPQRKGDPLLKSFFPLTAWMTVHFFCHFLQTCDLAENIDTWCS